MRKGTSDRLLRCWICGEPANSAEHRLKKADLVRAYGRGPYKGGSAPVHVRGGKIRAIQGPGAGTLKYPTSLCQKCNTTFTQPFDRAYDKLISWIHANESGVLRKRFVDFADVYGEQFEVPQTDLYKYFAKSFGCRLVEAGTAVPADIVQLLGQPTFRTRLRITFSVDEDVLTMLPPDVQKNFIGKGDLVQWADRQNRSQVTGYTFHEHVSWFTTNYWYDSPPDPTSGSTWTANSRVIYLGAIARMSDQERRETLRKLNRVT